MRLYASIAAVTAVTAIVGLSSGARVSAATTKSNNKPNTTINETEVAPEPTKVTVQPGDNLSEIAASYATTYVRIFDANMQIQDPNLIYPGEVLIIPLPTTQLTSRILPQPQSSQVVQPVGGETEQPEVVSGTSGGNGQTAQPVSTPPTNTSIWDQLAQCESGGNWSINTGNGFYGGLQFTLSSWQAAGGSGYPNLASKTEQILRAQILQSMQGWNAWPVCSVRIGL